MTDTTPEMPLRIWAQARGVHVRHPSGEVIQSGGWTAEPTGRFTAYVRADAEAGMRRIEAIAESGRKAEAEAERLRDRVTELEALLVECAAGLEAEVEGGYSPEMRKYPLMMRRYRRDIEPVIRARAALGEVET